jgi:pyruvate/2-oxoglutarate dehydrogenase complex dihydrolipoamide acyltransferase (E2) component
MKMVLRLAAPCDGVVAELGCAEGDMIARHSLVAEVRPPQVEAAAGGADSARREEP